jgi:hypothetical protein
MSFMIRLAMLACLCVGPQAIAHGDVVPKHGGIVKVSKDLTFELVIGANAAVVYVEDHGRAVPTAGMSGRLTALQGLKTSEAVLKSGGKNRLDAAGIAIASGSKVLAKITLPDGTKTFNVWFTVP